MTGLRLLILIFVCLALPATAFAGGAWVPSPGDGDVQIGFSQKTANRSWDSRGDTIVHGSHHDFRYTYLSGEIGVLNRLSMTFLVTYLDGREGPPDDYEKNSGMSDAWFGLKYKLRDGDWPMALAATLRTPIFYDIDGPYSRYLYDRNGNIIDESPEWRGVLKNDLTISYLISHSIKDGRGWLSFEAGYVFREGAPADQIPLIAEVGLPIPWKDMRFKINATVFQSVGNDSPRQPDDRFGSRTGYNFNNASLGRIGGSFMIPLGADKAWTAEIGYNQWLWGKSARQYDEPYASLGYRF